ncbi:HNH endonuclease [Thermodesulfobacteriota bacterium]
MTNFIETIQKKETIWRSIILFGRNVASYKFALGKSLLEIASAEKTFVSLEDLAEPFSRNLCEHLKMTDKQGTSPESRFLDKCRQFNRGESSKDDLIDTTVSLGFTNVIDAFHVVGKGEVPDRFFIDERKGKNGITITDNLLSLKEQLQFSNFPFEVEARWRLVETAWSLNISPRLLEVKYDNDQHLLFTQIDPTRRVNITSCRDSLNGYQKGKCFYCHQKIVVDDSVPELMTDVDHFFPHMLSPYITDVNLDGVWNLVLACRECNRGVGGKFESIPKLYLLERLHTRNEWFIGSHHPLKETIINQTGNTLEKRKKFLQEMDRRSIEFLIHRWEPPESHNHE